MGAPDVPAYSVSAGEVLQHVSRTRYRATPIHFGRDGNNRYDDPEQAFGTLYAGFDLSTALMETVFHKHQWHRRRKRGITRTEINGRMVRAIGTLAALDLADLTAPGVMASQFGLNLSQLASRGYIHTQRISAIVHRMADRTGAPRFDGLLYPSRNNHPAACAVLFDRTEAKLDVVDDIDLADHVDWPAFVAGYHIVVLPK